MDGNNIVSQLINLLILTFSWFIILYWVFIVQNCKNDKKSKTLSQVTSITEKHVFHEIQWSQAPQRENKNWLQIQSNHRLSAYSNTVRLPTCCGCLNKDSDSVLMLTPQSHPNPHAQIPLILIHHFLLATQLIPVQGHGSQLTVDRS